jgi:hypothetical protein
VKLDTLEFQSSVANQTNSGFLETRTVQKINTIDWRHIVELDIPGSIGNILQDMGSDPVRISLIGEFGGIDAKKALEQLRTKYDSNQPFNFSSELTTVVAEVNKVLIEELYVEEIAAAVNRYRYYMVLKEYREPRPQQQQQATQQQVQINSALRDIRVEVTDSTGKPVANIPVLVKWPDGRQQKFQSDSSGIVDILDAMQGRYEISIDDQKYKHTKQEVTVK